MDYKLAWKIILTANDVECRTNEEEAAFIDHLDQQEGILETLDNHWCMRDKLYELLETFTKPPLGPLDLNRLYYKKGSTLYNTQYFLPTHEGVGMVGGFLVTRHKGVDETSISRHRIPGEEWCLAPEHVESEVAPVLSDYLDSLNVRVETTRLAQVRLEELLTKVKEVIE